MVRFDDILDRVGPFGCYQASKMIAYMFCNLPFGWHMLSIIFVGGDQDYWCDVPGLQNLTEERQKYIGIPQELMSNGEYKYSQCKRFDLNFTQFTEAELLGWNRSVNIGNDTKTTECTRFRFSTSPYESTIYQQFELTCGKSWLVPMTQSVFMVGWLLGTTVFGHVSDRLGRRIAFFITFSMLIGIGAIQTFVPYIALYMVTKLLIGAAAGSFISISLVLVLEVVGSKHRVWVSVVFHFGYGMSLFALPGIAYLLRDHFKLQLVLGFSPMVLLFIFIMVDESPRWLIQKRRFKQAEEILKKISRMNRRRVADDDPEIILLIREATHDIDRVKELTKDKQPGLLDIMRIPNLRKISIIVFAQWLSVNTAFYALFLLPGAVGADAYVTTMLAGVAAPIGFAIVIPVMMKCGRRWSMILTGVATGVCLLVAAGIMHRKDLNPVLATIIFVSRVFIQGGTCTLYLFTAELFPTVVRNVGLGAASSFARIGALIGPQMALLIPIWHPLPVVILGVMAVVTGVLNYFLPDTLNQKLPETLEDGANFGKSKAKGKENETTEEKKRLQKPEVTSDKQEPESEQPLNIKFLAAKESSTAPLADFSDI